jgi:predicted RNA-binding Zn-ribbon protein involved in translation (DUF1610 family)
MMSLRGADRLTVGQQRRVAIYQELAATILDCKSPRKHVLRARIPSLTAEDCGAAGIMRPANARKTAAWHCQECSKN